MPLFRKQPVVIEAVQWFPGVVHAGVTVEKCGFPIDGSYDRPYVITAHEQKAYLATGDWILPEPMPDRFCPCKPDIFAETYEAADVVPASLADKARTDARFIQKVADAIRAVEPGYSMRLVSLVDGVSTYEVVYEGGERHEFNSAEDVYEHIRHKVSSQQAHAAIAVAVPLILRKALPPASDTDRKLARAVDALRPFATFGQMEDGEDIRAGLMRDRICDWFGPSQFDSARTTLTDITTAPAEAERETAQ